MEKTEKCYCMEIKDLCPVCEDAAIRKCDGSTLDPEDDSEGVEI